MWLLLISSACFIFECSLLLELCSEKKEFFPDDYSLEYCELQQIGRGVGVGVLVLGVKNRLALIDESMVLLFVSFASWVF